MRNIPFLVWMILATATPSIAVTGNELPKYMPVIDAQSPYAAATAGQFARDCRDNEASCASIIGNVLMAKIQFSPTSHLCLSDVDYANAVTPWLRTHPEAAALSVEDGIFLALNKLYKCGPPNNY